MDRLRPIRAWWAEREHNPAFQNAVKALRLLGGTDDEQALTLHHLIVACYRAAHYSPDSDPHVKRRAELEASRARTAELRQAAHLLTKACERKDATLSWAMEIAEFKSGVRITRREHDGPAETEKVAARYFSALEKALNEKLPEVDGGPFLHRTRIGNLEFPEPVSAGRKGDVEVITMLAFELEFRLRLHTARRVRDAPQFGQLMPEDGKPCRHVVAAWINAAFPPSEAREVVTARNIHDRIRRLPKGTGLMEFPEVANS